MAHNMKESHVSQLEHWSCCLGMEVKPWSLSLTPPNCSQMITTLSNYQTGTSLECWSHMMGSVSWCQFCREVVLLFYISEVLAIHNTHLVMLMLLIVFSILCATGMTLSCLLCLLSSLFSVQVVGKRAQRSQSVFLTSYTLELHQQNLMVFSEVILDLQHSTAHHKHKAEIYCNSVDLLEWHCS